MQDIIARLRAKKQDEGFTLIELLVVVVIIGVLVAIAVPVYLNYRQGAADKSAQSDVRGAVSAVEQYYTNNGNTYPTPSKEQDNKSGSAATSTLTLPKASAAGTDATITLSDKTHLAYVAVAGGKTYKLCAINDGGSNKWYLYDSSAGGSVKEGTGTMNPTTC
ncbi:prepilin-type N-terminal cleavage/methylation domain-containing protein [Actinoplanes sp. NPDC049668]|uniref:prepilin-type N-terminal cleavage/methylation domain-containing protein n=1 Tax=unclassified Actinoplanes TaxID=2626549 RepID=UPI0033BC4402